MTCSDNYTATCNHTLQLTEDINNLCNIKTYVKHKILFIQISSFEFLNSWMTHCCMRQRDDDDNDDIDDDAADDDDDDDDDDDVNILGINTIITDAVSESDYLLPISSI